jgi:hypothetical protein
MQVCCIVDDRAELMGSIKMLQGRTCLFLHFSDSNWELTCVYVNSCAGDTWSSAEQSATSEADADIPKEFRCLGECQSWRKKLVYASNLMMVGDELYNKSCSNDVLHLYYIA